MTYKSVKDRPWYTTLYKDEHANKEFDPTETTINTSRLNTVVIDWVIQVEDNGQFELFLLREFQQFYEGWNRDIFGAVEPRLRKVVKELFRQRGVYTQINSQDTITTQLFHLLSLAKCPTWPDDELQLMRLVDGFKCGQIAEETNINRPDNQPPLPNMRYTRYTPSPAHQNVTALTKLAKLYKNDDKFTGDKYDVLNHKLVIFKELCSEVGIEPDRYKLAVFTMLSGKASTYYYQSIAPLDLDFEGIISKLGAYFHTTENYQLFLNEWRTTMLKDVIANNPEKTLAQCLEAVIKKLHKLYQAMAQQNGLSEKSLTGQLISACQSVEACLIALIRPASTFKEVASELRKAVSNWSQCHPRTQFNYDEEPAQAQGGDIFYTNRRYKRNDNPQTYGTNRQSNGSHGFTPHVRSRYPIRRQHHKK